MRNWPVHVPNDWLMPPVPDKPGPSARWRWLMAAFLNAAGQLQVGMWRCRGAYATVGRRTPTCPR